MVKLLVSCSASPDKLWQSITLWMLSAVSLAASAALPALMSAVL
jgi:hypothetical protein